MKQILLIITSLGLLVLATGLMIHCEQPARAYYDGEENSNASSEWVYYGSDGRLVYRISSTGDHIMDFSTAGYMGGGVKIPMVPVARRVSPSGSDDSSAIQSAIDEVSAMPVENGFRGAVVLDPGVYICSKALMIKAGGVVLRGSGADPDGTIIRLTGRPHVFVQILGPKAPEITGRPIPITESYVPSGAMVLDLRDTAGLNVGDSILINRPATPAWVDFMGMSELARRDKVEHWVSGNITTERSITGISSNQISLNAPMTDSLDSRYISPPGGSVVRCNLSNRITQIGVENLRIICPPQRININQTPYSAVRVNGAADVWIRNLFASETVGSIDIGDYAARVTVQNVAITHTVVTVGAALFADYGCSGTQVLFNRCYDTGNHLFYFATFGRVNGPNVLLNCVFHGDGTIEPHMRWATGLLVDNCQVPEGGIDLINRGEMGSGHGWAIGWAVAWNCQARSFVIQQPPGSENWAIGDIGRENLQAMPFQKSPLLPQGIIDSQGTKVNPGSLYLAQLSQRLGPEALNNIGY
ncbi:MAG TPA: hypothetical protein VMG59_05050 [Phycisphaerae bacterium]|nr:hypothetical protein [Phycisphaerae bacterium]